MAVSATPLINSTSKTVVPIADPTTPMLFSVVGHTHEISGVTGLQESLDSKQVSGDYATNTALSGTEQYLLGLINTAQPLGDYATNSSVEITAAKLTEILNTKQPSGDYSIEGHTHEISGVTNLQETLDSKQPSGDYQPYSDNLNVWDSKDAPSGSVVGTTDEQTIDNKTLGDCGEVVYYGGILGISYTLDTSNGAVQSFTLSENITFTLPSTPVSGTTKALTVWLKQDTNGGCALEPFIGNWEDINGEVVTPTLNTSPDKYTEIFINWHTMKNVWIVRLGAKDA